MERIGLINRYTCEVCHAVHGTINLNTGVTPFMIGCKKAGCLGLAQSSLYCLPATKEFGCGWAWYRPIVDEFKTLGAATQEHILGGGLILGDIESVHRMLEPDEISDAIVNGDVDKWLGYIAGAYDTNSEIFFRVAKKLGSKAFCS